MEAIAAIVNEDLCSGYGKCEYLCPYGAVEMKDKDGKSIANMIEALRKGCSTRGTACPTKTVTKRHFTANEMLAQVKTALVEVKT